VKKIKLKIRLRTSLLIGGQSQSILADIATARDAAGAPIIPASALKGAIRIEFERLARSILDEKVCSAGNSEQACGFENPCMACRIFGSPGLEGKLRFSDAILKDESLRKLFAERDSETGEEKPTGLGYSTRYGIGVSRSQKSVVEQLLFSSETLAPFTPECTLEADVSLIEELSDDEFRLLKFSVSNLRAIGADKSRGLGQVEAELLELSEKENEKGGTQTDEQSQSVPSGRTDVMLTLIPQEYIRVSSVKAATNFWDTMEFIPGSTVRGAAAKSFAMELPNRWKDDAIKQVFLKDTTLFSNFYPTIGGAVPPKPIPLSARTCKAYEGFVRRTATDKSRGSHGAKDILITSTVAKKLREASFPAVLDEKCEFCDSPLKQITGFYQSLHREAEERNLRRMNTKTAINRECLTSEEGQLYSYELIDTRLENLEEAGKGEKERLRFMGTITNITPDLRKHLKETKFLFIGGARNRGFGKVSIIVEDLVLAEENEEGWSERLQSFTNAIVQPLSQAGLDFKNTIFFSLTLTSDLVLPPWETEEWFLSSIDANLGLAKDKIKLEKSIAQTSCRGGFNDAIGIRKPIYPVLSKGSAFVFSCPAKFRDAILSELPELLRHGIGACRDEGFGRFSFCDSFHIERINQR
jgi:CRISPR-associated Csx10 family RAMP protein